MFPASPVRNAVRSPLGERAAFSYLKADLRDVVRKKGRGLGAYTRLSILRRRRECRLSFEFSVWRLSRNFLPGSSQQDTACRGGGPLSVFFLLRDDQAKKREHRSWLPSCAGRYHGVESSGMERYAGGFFSRALCSSEHGAFICRIPAERRDRMAARLGLRMTLDAAMVPVFVLLMTARYTGVGVHEGLSLLFVLLMAAHLYLNGSWWTALPRLVRARPCRTLLTLAAAVFLAAALISGVPLSEHLSVLTGWKTDLTGRSRHMFFAHWAFLLGAAHIGLCRKRLVSALVRVMPRRMLPYLSAAVLIPALYGVQAFAERDLTLLLTMTTSFTVWNPEDHLFRLLMDYLAVFCLSASAAGAASFLFERAARIAMPSRGTCSGAPRESTQAESGRKLPRSCLSYRCGFGTIRNRKRIGRPEPE